MQHVVDAVDGAARHVEIGQVAVEKVHLRQVRQVLPLAGNETVDDANALAPADELLRQVRTDESGTAGHQVMSHIADPSQQKTCRSPAMDGRVRPMARQAEPGVRWLHRRLSGERRSGNTRNQLQRVLVVQLAQHGVGKRQCRTASRTRGSRGSSRNIRRRSRTRARSTGTRRAGSCPCRRESGPGTSRRSRVPSRGWRPRS